MEYRRISHYISDYFNITENGSIDYHNYKIPDISENYFLLLYRPLPMDLLSVNKNTLIIIVVYIDNIDRYIRLYRPIIICFEFFCIFRNIY